MGITSLLSWTLTLRDGGLSFSPVTSALHNNHPWPLGNVLKPTEIKCTRVRVRIRECACSCASIHFICKHLCQAMHHRRSLDTANNVLTKKISTEMQWVYSHREKGVFTWRLGWSAVI